MKTRALLISSGVALGSFVASTEAHAAGPGLAIQSGRGLGMASAMTAHPAGADSISLHPAGIAPRQPHPLPPGTPPYVRSP